MKKQDLDALAGLYESVYSPAESGEYLSEEYLEEQGGRGSSSASQTNQSVSGAQLLYGPSGKPQSPSSRPTNVRGGGTRAVRPTASPTQSRFAGARDAAFAKARQIKGSPVVGPKPTERPAAPSLAVTKPAAAKPAATTGAPKVAPSSSSSTAPAAPKKTFNPLMQKTFGYQTGYAPDQIKNDAKKMAVTGSVKNISQSYEWPSAKTIRDIADAYASIYEAKKKDQDQDGDNDFADVRIARMIASGMSRAEAIAAVKNKEYNEEFESWVDSLVEEGYDLSDYTMEEMFGIYLDEAEGSYGQTPKARTAMGKLLMARSGKPASEYGKRGEKTRKVKAAEKHTRRMDDGPDVGNRGKRSTSPRWSGYLGATGRGKLDQDSRDWSRERDVEYSAGENKPGPGTVTKNPKKLRKQRAMGEFGEAYELDEATRMRKELGKEGEIATRKELAARSKAFKRSDSVDKTITAAERGADRPYVKHKRGESDSDRSKREEKQSRTLRGLASSRRGSVRDNPRAGMRGYAAKVEGSDKDLQAARQKAMAAGTLTPKEKKQLGEEYAIYEIVASYLLENNFAETIDDANAIIENMSENWLEEILIEKSGEQPLPYGRMMKKSDELSDSDDPKKQKRAAAIYLAANAPKGPKVKKRR